MTGLHNRNIIAKNCCPKCGRPYADKLEKQGITINFLTVQYADQSLVFTPQKMEVFKVLFRGFPQVVSREVIFNTVWGGASDVEERTLDVFICLIRKQLKTLGLAIENVWGIGYKLVIEK